MKWYLRPIKAIILGGLFFLSTKTFAQPANNECTGAIMLTSNSTCINTAGTLAAATWTPPLTGCGATNKLDVWYSFVAVSTSQTVTLSGGTNQLRLQLFSGSCGSLSSVTCGNSTMSSTALTIGATYYIRVYSQNNSTPTFSICVTHPAPANDNCSGAISLTSNATCVNITGTLDQSTTSTGFAAGCAPGGTHYDVWYSFVAVSTTETVTISNLGANINNSAIQLYSGTCGSLTSLACGTTFITQGSLTIGNTYYVRVSNVGSNPAGAGNFDICVTHTAPANDECAGAITLTSGSSCINTSGTLVGATYSTIASIGCGTADRNDVWYSFVAASANTTITLSSLGNSRLQIFSGSCGALTSVACGTTSIASTTLTPGATYYVRVYADPNTLTGTFNICVTHAAPVNDECASAITLSSYTSCVNTAGTLNLSTANGSTPGGCAAGTYYDVWYTFTGNGLAQTVTLSGLGVNVANPQVQIFSGTCAALTSRACGTTSATYTTTLGTTYYVRVANINADPSGTGTASNFNICLTHPGLANDQCQGAISISSTTGCSYTAGTLVGATYTAFTNCNYSEVDAWYSFVAQSPIPTITITGSVGRIQVQIYSGTCGALTCIGGTTGNTEPKTYNATNLVIGQTYYVRVTTNNGTTPTFSLCITDPIVSSPPSNDNCSGATTLTPGSGCTNIAGTLAGATVSSPTVSTNCGTPGADVWYSFTATSPFPTISLSSIQSNMQAGTSYIQLYTGTCGSLTPVYCTSGGGASLSLSPGGTGLAVGVTYYIRVFTGSTYTGGTNWNFNICITNPGTGSSANVEYSKSYVNLTKGTTGGSVEPGDILEIRATLVIRSGTIDSVAFYDTLQDNGGFSYETSSLAIKTNEGKVYQAFSDGYDTDGGTTNLVPSTSDRAIQLNMGRYATAEYRGLSLANTSRPSFYGSTCIIMATYQVQVNAGYDTKINWGGGAFTYRDAGNMKLVSFKNDSLVVYISPGLCANAVSTVNRVGIEFDGTFGAPTTPPVLARNRGTSTAVPSYTYAAFGAGGPNDYYYGIANNTSGGTYTTLNTFPKGGSVPQRVHNLWDITGDHTGATNTAKGNPPCDINQPVSTTNPCGYMLVVNAAYKTDTAFRSTITGLCPNTYYEISAWFKNVCYRCGNDSAGRGSGTAGYIPFAPQDSSGVQPNLAFQINGQDYYTTGNIPYVGTGGSITQTGSDSMNTWLKRGFVYKTEVGQSSFELVIRNNAPGGGGNDWAIDDIVVSSCVPIMTYSPSLLPTVCDSNTLRIYDTVRSSYENYSYYKWQRSTDGGANWTDVTGTMGPETPFWNGTAWEYTVHYDIPPGNTTPADSADLYRMIVATTATNLSSPSCQATDVVSIITLSVIDCGIALKTDILSFSGKLVNDYSQLSWSTTTESEPVHFDVERSYDGINFTRISTVQGYNNPRSAINYYSYTDPSRLSGKAYYRIVMVNTSARTKQSRTIQLSNSKNQFTLASVVNPFSNELLFDLTTPVDGKVDVVLMDMVGKVTRERSYTVYTGMNSLRIENTSMLAPGVYVLQIRNKDAVISHKVVKK